MSEYKELCDRLLEFQDPRIQWGAITIASAAAILPKAANTIESLQLALSQAQRELEAARKDAERYRWLRTRINYKDAEASDGALSWRERQWTHVWYDFTHDTIDGHIDAALAAQTRQEET